MQNDQEKWTGKRRRTLVDVEEERVWAAFYHRAADPVVAAELVVQLERNASLLAQHGGLYVRCKYVVRREKARQARLRKIGASLRWVAYAMLGLPVRLTLRLLRVMGDVMLACLPEHRDPVADQLRKLAPAVPVNIVPPVPEAHPQSSGAKHDAVPEPVSELAVQAHAQVVASPQKAKRREAKVAGGSGS